MYKIYNKNYNNSICQQHFSCYTYHIMQRFPHFNLLVVHTIKHTEFYQIFLLHRKLNYDVYFFVYLTYRFQAFTCRYIYNWTCTWILITSAASACYLYDPFCSPVTNNFSFKTEIVKIQFHRYCDSIICRGFVRSCVCGVS